MTGVQTCALPICHPELKAQFTLPFGPYIIPILSAITALVLMYFLRQGNPLVWGWFPLVWLAFLFSIPLWMTDQYVLHILVVTGIFIVAAISLNLLLGFTDLLSFGHAAFFGGAAYVTGWLVHEQHWTPELALLEIGRAHV